MGGSLQAASLGGFSQLGISNVFLIMMENHDWSTMGGSPNCPYINNTLLPRASLATQYFTPPGNHPSEPNYIWLVAGTNFGIDNDDAPSANQKNTTNHLAFLLDRAGIPWKSYQESISGKDIPIVNNGDYAVRHNPFMFFKNITTNLAYVTNHVRPFEELATDLANNKVRGFNFITPNLTNDMHNSVGGVSTRILGDHWLSLHVPTILSSRAFTNGGVLFIAWDEGSIGGSTGESDGPLGIIAASPVAKGHGYVNTIHYTHSSTLRTFQDILGVRPYLGDAAKANDLSDLFIPAPSVSDTSFVDIGLQVTVTNLWIGRTYELQTTTELPATKWTAVATKTATKTTHALVDPKAPRSDYDFYRVVALP
ncbi:MAG: phosphoesterase [Verrucomicrobia bacterium]|nr:phosphoesterase [Verrucomicrobiota bacterium]